MLILLIKGVMFALGLFLLFAGNDKWARLAGVSFMIPAPLSIVKYLVVFLSASENVLITFMNSIIVEYGVIVVLAVAGGVLLSMSKSGGTKSEGSAPSFETREWKSTKDDTVFSAIFVSMEKDSIFVNRTSDKKLVKMRIDKLAPADLSYLESKGVYSPAGK